MPVGMIAAAATASETARGLLISPAPRVHVHTEETDVTVMFRGVLQDPEVLSPSTESLLRGPKFTFMLFFRVGI
jgi:hypothetical protein